MYLVYLYSIHLSLKSTALFVMRCGVELKVSAVWGRSWTVQARRTDSLWALIVKNTFVGVLTASVFWQEGSVRTGIDDLSLCTLYVGVFVVGWCVRGARVWCVCVCGACVVRVCMWMVCLLFLPVDNQHIQCPCRFIVGSMLVRVWCMCEM